MMVILGGAEMISRIIVSRIGVSHIIAGLFAAMVLAGMPGPANAQSIFGWLFAQRIPREAVAFPGSYDPGTVVISTSQRRLYLVMTKNQALRYGIGVGREGFTWAGSAEITAKREWPDWTPRREMLARKPELPRHMAGGPQQPARRARHVSRRYALPNSRLQRARDHRHRDVFRLHPPDQ